MSEIDDRGHFRPAQSAIATPPALTHRLGATARRRAAGAQFFTADARSLRASAHFNKRQQRAATQRVQTTHARLAVRNRNSCVTIVTPRDQKILRQGKKTLASMVHRD
jgi:hypothetical protein